jgi:hypothetical protein
MPRAGSFELGLTLGIAMRGVDASLNEGNCC